MAFPPLALLFCVLLVPWIPPTAGALVSTLASEGVDTLIQARERWVTAARP